MKAINICSCLFLIFMTNTLPAQVKRPFFSLAVVVLDKKDPQAIKWEYTMYPDTILKDQQGRLRLYPDQPYHLKFLFAYQHKDGEINHNNYRTKRYRVEIKPSDPAKFKINAIVPVGEVEGISVHGICLAKSDEQLTFNFRLIDAQSRVLTDDDLPSNVLAEGPLAPGYFNKHFLEYWLKDEVLSPVDIEKLLQLEKDQQKLSKGGNN